MRERQRGQRVSGIVPALDPEFGLANDLLRAETEPVLPVKIRHAEFTGRGPRQRETERLPPLLRHRPDQGVVLIDHDQAVAGKDIALGGGIAGQRVIAIHMVRRDIQDRAGAGIQGRGRFQLKAGQLQHINIRFSPVIARQQVQRGRAQIAAHGHVITRGPQQFADQGGDRALAVGAGNGDHGRPGRAAKQFNIAIHRAARRQRPPDRRLSQRDPGAEHNHRRAQQ